ncbi:MAG: M48 family metalloprotease [Chloracidobacterium sp.]|nr:M48 family metalloprotease [Chloracidobacterium sp.]
MNTGFQAISLMTSLMVVAALALGQTGQRPLSDKENPLLIGKRNLNTDQTNLYTLDQEITLGRHLALEADREVRLVDDKLVTEYVNRVGQNIALHSDARMPFTIKIIDSDDINAFALPGGYLYVSRGALEAADSEAELAWFMAHLIGHVAARHGLEHASKTNYGSIPLIFRGGIGGFAIWQAAGLAVPLTSLKFLRGAEEEADQLGAQYMWASGYDQQAPGDFYKKLQVKEGANPGAFLRLFTKHLMTGDRIAKVNSLVARFPDRPEIKPTNSFEFSVIKARLLASDAEKRLADSPNSHPVLRRR